MRYLDEDIVLVLENRNSGYHNYQISIFNNDEDLTPEVIYNGRFYIAPWKTSIEVDITDILSNYRYLYKLPTDFEIDKTRPRAVNQVAGPNLIATVQLKDLTQDVAPDNIAEETVAFMYRYPNANYSHVYNDYENELTTNTDMFVSPMLQGTKFYNAVVDDNVEHLTYTPKYLPRYPLVSTSNYGIITSLLFNKRHSSEITYLLGDTLLWNTNIEDHYQGSYDKYFSMKGWLTNIQDFDSITDTTFYYSDIAKVITYYGIDCTYTFYHDVTHDEREELLNNFRHFYGNECADAIEQIILEGELQESLKIPTRDEDLNDATTKWQTFVNNYIPIRQDGSGKPIMTISSADPYEIETTMSYKTKTPLAILDKCPAEYYLMWQDRMGGIQSQPLRNKSVYSESMNQTTMTSYQNHKRPINAEIQPEWELMTDWIDDEFYDIWESIFTSAYILLYNTKLDKTYRVIISDKTFTQKTNKNQKQLFKHTIKLQLDKPQNIIS